MTHLLTDWMGDLGFLSELDVRVRRPNLLGDITWVSGTVTAVDGALVDCSVETRNQLNEVTATGMARVRLPMRTA